MAKNIKNILIYSRYQLKRWWLGDYCEKRVIALHDIGDAKKFREKMLWLKDNYELVSLADLFNRPLQNKTQVAVTFDDGYRNWLEAVAPVLKELNIPATFFVCSGFVGLQGEAARQFRHNNLKRERDLDGLTIDQLKELASCPLFEIGSHTVNHVDLGKQLTDDDLEKEIGGDKNYLEKLLGKSVCWFAYPFGQLKNISLAAENHLKKKGFLAAFTIIPGGIQPNGDNFLAGRNSLDINDSNWLWQARIGGGADRLKQQRIDNGVFICQAVDQNDPLLASTIGWIREFALQPEIKKLTVLALRVGEFDLLDNVEVIKIKGTNRWATTVNFYREILRRLKNVDWFFIYQGGHYPLLLLPFKLLGKPIYQWKAHPHIGWMMKFYALVCDTKIFTSTPSAFPMKFKKVKVVGQGVDTEKFKPLNIPKTGDWITVGRIAPVKRLEKAIELLADYNQRHNTKCRLNIYGPVLSGDENYLAQLKALVKKLQLDDLVNFRGAVTWNQLPELLNKHKLFVSFNNSALDRSVVEAMACGLPVITPNKCVIEILSPALKSLLIIPDDDLEKQSLCVRGILTMPDQQLASISNEVRRTIEADHSIISLIDKIIIILRN